MAQGAATTDRRIGTARPAQSSVEQPNAELLDRVAVAMNAPAFVGEAAT